MRSGLIAVILVSLTLVSCGQKVRGTYRCVFNCECRNRNIVHELEFANSRSVIISDGVDKKTHEYRVRGKNIEIEDLERAGSITIVNDYMFIVQGTDCLSGTYRKSQ